MNWGLRIFRNRVLYNRTLFRNIRHVYPKAKKSDAYRASIGGVGSHCNRRLSSTVGVGRSFVMGVVSKKHGIMTEIETNFFSVTVFADQHQNDDNCRGRRWLLTALVSFLFCSSNLLHVSHHVATTIIKAYLENSLWFSRFQAFIFRESEN